MIEIVTSFGTLYIESADSREEEERIKLYDSKKRYFDYFTVESIPEGQTVDEFISAVVEGIKKCKDYDDLMDYLGLDSWTASEDWTDILHEIGIQKDESYYNENGVWKDITGKVVDENYVLENEWVNVIGKTYILLCEN